MRDAPGPLPPGQHRAALVSAVGSGLRHLARDVHVVVACSGGPDSTALAFLVAEARPDLRLTLVHVRHGLRDDTADVEVTRQHAAWLGVDHREEVVEVVRSGDGIEAAARKARYAALRRIAAEVGAASILVGHTADDQAETVLLRLARGTGIDGLAAMAVVADDLTRPLLRLRRDDVRGFVALEGLPSVEDPSNQDPTIRRAVVRHEILPRFAQVGPDPVGALARIAELARDDVVALAEAAAPLAEQVRWVGDAAALPTAKLRAAPRSLAARVIRQVLTTLSGRAPTAEVVSRVLDAGRRARASLPGDVELTTARGWLTLAARQPATSPTTVIPDDADVGWEPAGRTLRSIVPSSAQEADDAQQLALEPIGVWTPPRIRLDAAAAPPGTCADRLTLPVPATLDGMEVRHRRAGDRITTPGGTRRVAQVMADAGMPRPLRDRWPVVSCGQRVVWVPGIAADRSVLAQGRAAPSRLLVLEPTPGRGGEVDR